jgi:DNA-binding GntR family transcriptional regulator
MGTKKVKRKLASDSIFSDSARKISPLSGKSGEVFSELESRFAQGVYKFGDLLSANELATQLGVSPQPMRAAIAQLRALGYVIVIPQVGCKVASPTVREIRDFFRMFGRMEGVMASFAAERHDTVEIKELDRIMLELGSGSTNVGEETLPPNYARLVGEWHAAIRGMARSPVLEWRLKSFWNMSDFFLFQGAPNISVRNIRVANKERQAIRNAIKARDAAIAEELMNKHVLGKPLRVGIIPKETTKS